MEKGFKNNAMNPGRASSPAAPLDANTGRASGRAPGVQGGQMAASLARNGMGGLESAAVNAVSSSTQRMS
jgi:hypothetical protein